MLHDGNDITPRSENQTGCEGSTDFPWAWLKAFNDIVNEPPPEIIPDPPVAVLPWLYLAPMYCVRDRAANLREDLGITHALSTNRMPPKVLESLYWELRSHEVDHHYVAAEDQLSYDMMSHWDECRDFLQLCINYQDEGEGDDKTARPGKALVHCNAGMNRSGTIVAAAMMHFGKMDLLQVGRELKAKRGYVLSNSSFVRQLVVFAAEQGRLGDKPPGYSDEPIS
jgi:hypothetical protein